MQPLEEPRDLCTAAVIGGGTGAKEVGANMAIAEAQERVLAAQDRGEEGDVGGYGRVERA